MTSLNRIAACASALALASGAALAGAGIAGAQGSSEIAAGLGLAASALDGPVTVAGNAEGGPTVSYTNESGVAQKCIGFTMPYSSVVEVGFNPPGDGPASDLLPQVLAIQEMGGVSVLNALLGGNPTAYDATAGDGVTEAVSMLVAGWGGLGLDDGETVTWTATAPEEPAAAAVLCISDSIQGEEERLEAIDVQIGIDPQAVVDQINGIVPGGSVTAGSISGGSLEMGAGLLGSLGS